MRSDTYVIRSLVNPGVVFTPIATGSGSYIIILTPFQPGNKSQQWQLWVDKEKTYITNVDNKLKLGTRGEPDPFVPVEATKGGWEWTITKQSEDGPLVVRIGTPINGNLSMAVRIPQVGQQVIVQPEGAGNPSLSLWMLQQVDED